MGASLTCAEHRTRRRFYRNDLHILFALFQIFSDSAQCSAGPDAGDKEVHFTVGIFPDLRTCRCIVRSGIGGVHKLSRNKGPFCLLCELLRLLDRTFHSFRSFRQDNLCAVCLQDVPSLHAHGLRHRQNDPVSFSCSNGCKADPGIAAGRFDDHRAFFQKSLLFRVLDHGLCDTVLHGTSRIEILQFCENSCLEAKLLLKIHKLNQRCVSDQSQRSPVHFSHNISPPVVI